MRDGRLEVRHELLQGGEERPDEALGAAYLRVEQALAVREGVGGDAEGEGGDAHGGVDDQDELDKLVQAPGGRQPGGFVF